MELLKGPDPKRRDLAYRLCAELMYNQGWHDANQGL